MNIGKKIMKLNDFETLGAKDSSVLPFHTLRSKVSWYALVYGSYIYL